MKATEKQFPKIIILLVKEYLMYFFSFLLRYDINRNFMLLCFLLLNAIFLAVIPICRTLWLLILSTAAAGFSVGILDTATNVQLIGIHGKKVEMSYFLT